MKVRVEVVQRQGMFADMQFVNRQFAGDHHRHLGQLDGERIDIHAVEICRGHEAHYPLLGSKLLGQFATSFNDTRFQSLQLTVGYIEEIARTTGGIEHRKIMQTLQQLVETAHGRCIFDLLSPRFHDRRPDDLHDIDRAGEVRHRRRVALLFPWSARTERRKSPAEPGTNQHAAACRSCASLVRPKFDVRRLGEQAPIEILDALETSSRGHARRVHGNEQSPSRS